MLQTGKEDERLTGKVARRRYLRSLETISKRVHDNMLIGDFEQRQIWIETLTRAAGAAKFLLDEAKTYEKHSREGRPEDESNEMEERKERAPEASAASGSGVDPGIGKGCLMVAKAKKRPTVGKVEVRTPPTPPPPPAASRK